MGESLIARAETEVRESPAGIETPSGEKTIKGTVEKTSRSVDRLLFPEENDVPRKSYWIGNRSLKEAPLGLGEERPNEGEIAVANFIAENIMCKIAINNKIIVEEKNHRRQKHDTTTWNITKRSDHADEIEVSPETLDSVNTQSMGPTLWKVHIADDNKESVEERLKFINPYSLIWDEGSGEIVYQHEGDAEKSFRITITKALQNPKVEEDGNPVEQANQLP